MALMALMALEGPPQFYDIIQRCHSDLTKLEHFGLLDLGINFVVGSRVSSRALRARCLGFLLRGLITRCLGTGGLWTTLLGRALFCRGSIPIGTVGGLLGRYFDGIEFFRLADSEHIFDRNRLRVLVNTAHVKIKSVVKKE